MIVDLHVESSWNGGATPADSEFSDWVAAALAGRRDNSEVAIQIVDRDEGAYFNQRYRKREGATNVLSFPADLPPGVELPLIGDLIICAPVVVAEARTQGKDPTAHWAHLTVHGVLHLIGYDHQNDADATIMEGLEIAILESLGYSNPYHTGLR